MSTTDWCAKISNCVLKKKLISGLHYLPTAKVFLCVWGGRGGAGGSVGVWGVWGGVCVGGEGEGQSNKPNKLPVPRTKLPRQNCTLFSPETQSLGSGVHGKPDSGFNTLTQ